MDERDVRFEILVAVQGIYRGCVEIRRNLDERQLVRFFYSLPHAPIQTLQLVLVHYRCNQPMSPLQQLAKGAPPFITTSPSTCRPFPIISVNTRPKDVEGNGPGSA